MIHVVSSVKSQAKSLRKCKNDKTNNLMHWKWIITGEFPPYSKEALILLYIAGEPDRLCECGCGRIRQGGRSQLAFIGLENP